MMQTIVFTYPVLAL